ncbi:MAG TPA: sensor histidine kinase [Pseudogracilibacillus sp.]|nr:sensor histidine kinase [Pseudogracilibacillus sp.]
MLKNKVKEKTLDKIIEEMTTAVEKSKEEIFHISEETREELAELEKELVETKFLVKEQIRKGDELERQVKIFRKKLATVSREFNRYSEGDIREVYEQTHALQTELILVQQEEIALRKKRNEIEQRIVRLRRTIEHATNLGRKVSVVLTYLHDDFSQVNEVIKSAQEKQQIGLKIIEAQEVERKRISRDIHDGPAQMLANILIRSEIIDLSFRDGDIDNALKEMKSIRENIRSSLKEVRRIIYDLRPMALDDLGLFPTVKKHVQTMSEYHNIDISLNLLGDEKRLEASYEIAIFRLVQEALQNAIKHADATRINVALETLPDQITIIVRDNGKGFDPEALPQNDHSFGLVGMKERVETLDGELIIDSKVGKGTRVNIVIPYNPDRKS